MGTTRRRPLVGAIRWDAWHGEAGSPGRAVQRALSPARYHWRLPFFAEVRGEDDVVIDGTPQAVMDAEIAAAAEASLDYWAFVTYAEDDAMSLGLQRYLSSRDRERINFCLLTEATRWAYPDFIDRIIRHMREPGYQTVLDDRPLLYLGFLEEAAVLQQWGSVPAFRAVIDDLRARLRGVGMAAPYLVILDFDPIKGKYWADALGGDALSSYAIPWADDPPAPYARLAQADVNFWHACRATGAAVVPIITSGWDRRPRIERPMPWETWQQAGVGLERYTEAATPAELAAHVREALDWITRDPDAAPAQVSLIYAWNENDEGGWIVPTRREGPTRLNAIGAMLRAWEYEA